ncbi:unnamed protein product [marine sediment metagenome]|uniref:Uncharacterized protein n=1 Tax=marine sediment metagenome TaxID=412755 RepID=X1IH87_9ZZZZ
MVAGRVRPEVAAAVPTPVAAQRAVLAVVKVEVRVADQGEKDSVRIYR